MSNTKNNTRRPSRILKKGKNPEEMQDMFVQWLTALVQDTRGRAVVRTLVEENELPVIDHATRHMRRG